MPNKALQQTGHANEACARHQAAPRVSRLLSWLFGEERRALRRIAFDLDETLGVPLIDGANVVGWQMRPGCAEMLERLQREFGLLLWSVSPRRYVDKALAFGLGRWFAESHSWDELPARWKDVRQLRADFLVDDSPHHREEAERLGLEAAYIVVPAYGSPEDASDPLAWVRLIETVVR